MDVENILQELPVLVYRVNPEGIITFVNSQVKFYGYESGELIGRHILDLVHPDDRDRVEFHLRTRRGGKRATRNLRLRLLTKERTARTFDVITRSEWLDSEIQNLVELSVFATGMYDEGEFQGTYGVAWDISETVAAQKLLNRLLEDSPVGMAIYDENGIILSANDQFKRIFALEPFIAGETKIWDFIAEEDQSKARSRIKRLLKGETVEPEQFKGVANDGRDLSLEVRPRPFILAGEPRIHVTVIDLSEREEYNKRLSESEKRYRSVFENANDAVFLMRGNKFIECNRKTLEMFGLDDYDEIIQHTPLDFSPEFQLDDTTSQEAAADYIQKAVSGTPQRFKWIHTKADGREFPTEVSLSHLRLNREDLLLAIVRDQSKMEKRFRLEKIASELAIDFITLPLNDPDSWRTVIRNAFSKVIDLLNADKIALYIVNEERGTLVPEYYYFSPGVEPPANYSDSIPLNPLKRLLENTDPPNSTLIINDTSDVQSTELKEIVGRSGSRTLVSVPLLFRNSWVGAFTIGWLDPGRAREEEIHDIQLLASVFAALLERRRVYEKETLLTSQLYQAQKMEEVGRLSSGVAHDFNNLLTVIIGNTEILRSLLAADPTVSTQTDPLIEGVRNAADMASSLTRQLLLFSRTAHANNRVVKLNDLVKTMQKVISRITPASVVKQVHLQSSLPNIFADPTHIQQIILNLCVNAVDAMSDGGKLELTTRLAEMEGERSCRLCQRPIHGRFVALTIRDNGTGISDKLQEKIFQPFFTTKETGKGTGLGLATVANIVKDYSGGHLLMRSGLGEGTTFDILFPIHEIEDEAFTNDSTELTDSHDSLSGTAVLVEDNPHLVKLLNKVLEQNGIIVRSFTNAGEAWKWLSDMENSVDVVITDQVMPGMTGIELARLLHEIRPELPVLFMSGYVPDDDFIETIEELKLPFLPKPFSTKDFVQEIQKILSRS
jgi:PAS domain S-box-containing protein